MNLCQNVCHHEKGTNLKVGHVESKIAHWVKSGKSCVYSRRHSFDPICIKLCQNVVTMKSRTSLKLGHVRSKSRSLDQVLEKQFLHSKGLKVLFQSL